MCFSEEASFTVATVVGGVGCYLVNKFKHDKKLFLAMIPLFFAIQQFSEGILWNALDNHHYPDIYSNIAQYTFMFFAYCFWPFWMPFALMYAEQVPGRRSMIRIFVFLGALMILFNAYLIFVPGPENVKIIGWNISYGESLLIYQIDYLFVAITSFFISSIPKMWLIGLGLLVAFVISQIVYPHAFASISCLGAAIVTAGLLFVLNKKKSEVGSQKSEGK